jgi:hypothetical protein
MPRMKSGNHESLVQLVRDLGGRAGCDLVGMDLDQLLPLGADPAQTRSIQDLIGNLRPPRIHRLILNLRSFDPERDSHGDHPLFVLVADLNDDNMVRGSQRHVLGDLACKVHSMALGAPQILELRTGMIRTKSQPLADVEIVSRHGCAPTADGSYNAQITVVFAGPNSADRKLRL